MNKEGMFCVNVVKFCGKEKSSLQISVMRAAILCAAFAWLNDKTVYKLTRKATMKKAS
jgi:hypothetical protein